MAPKSSFFEGNFLTSSSIIFAGSFLVNVLNYVFTLLMSRILGVDSFGEVAAMISLFTIISVPSTALTMLMAREIAARKAGRESEIQPLFYFLRKNAIVVALIAWVIFIGCIPLLSYFLHIPYAPFFVFSVLILFLAPSALQVGTLQGLQEFFSLAKQNVLSAIVKLVLSIIFVLLGYSILGVMGALVCASATSWLYGFWMTKRKIPVSETSQLDSNVSFGSLYASVFITSLLLALLSNTDLLLAKHFLEPSIAGQYAALSTMGNIIVYGIAAFTTVLLPMASFARASGEGKERRVLGFSLAVIACAALLAWLAFTVRPLLFVTILFGAKYAAIASTLSMYAFAEGCVALSIALINYFVAIRNTTFLYALGAGILAEIALIYTHHGSIGAVAGMFTTAAVVLLGLLVINYFLFASKEV